MRTYYRMEEYYVSSKKMKLEEQCMSRVATIYPDEEFVNDFSDSDYGSFLSTPGVDLLIYGNCIKRLGDSDVFVEISSTNKKGEAGMEDFKQYAMDFLVIIKDAIPKMSEKYSAFYQYFVDDFNKNGLSMPFYGKII